MGNTYFAIYGTSCNVMRVGKGLNIIIIMIIIRAGIAQLVKRMTEKPGAILTRVRVPGAARDFFSQSQLPVQTLPLNIVQLSCAIACINNCTHVKHPNCWQPYHCLDTRKILHPLQYFKSSLKTFLFLKTFSSVSLP